MCHQRMAVGEKGLKKIQNKIAVLVIVGLFFVSGISIISSNKVSGGKPFFSLVLKFFQNPEQAGYGNLIRLSLAKIGIDVDVLTVGSFWYPPLVILRNTDLGILEFKTTSNYADPDITGVYDENGSINVFGYHTSMDWNESLDTGQNEWYMDQGKLIMPPNSEERIQHYWNWENYLMDDLLLCQPLFNRKSYVQTWDKLFGYNYCKGILQSWGDMYWSAPHVGQISTSELVIGGGEWYNLNPLLEDFSSEKFITNAIIDPLFWLDPNSIIKPHLATNFSMLNDTHVRINLREGIKWQSDPDGNFTDEYFDAEDVYFSLYCWKELSLLKYYRTHHWIKEMKIINPYTIDIYIDGDPGTQENEPYFRFLEMLGIKMLPEHYLNQTQYSEGDPDLGHHSWEIFSSNCFGTGLFSLDSYTERSETVLAINPDCWWLNNSITNDPNLNWQQRFGDFTDILQKLRIKIMNPSINSFIFKDGEIDISSEQSSKPSDSYGIETYSKRKKTMSFLSYNVREIRPVIGNNEPCENDPSITKGLAVRKAISYAIDRIEINDIVHGGECFVTDYPIYEALSIWCNPNIIRYNYDLEKAKYYMNLAGFAEPVIMGFEMINLFHLSFSVMIIVVIIKQRKKSEKDKQ